ncbi:MAG: outer membrane lipoprotein carrier protein LolA [Chitinophagaceae bacterium]|jgi:outer membrane lipoprotein-sorting protein|nr:outer membrane lipoprotein carrier protein LolA [Chitinophagaceae bacterium]OQY93825.1 MAG: lipoprotein carrier protein LolA [Sphingobacteriales bacterium UTBCD1]
MKNFYLLSLLMAFGVIAGAQKNDPEAKKILDGVSTKFKSFKTVQASFTYSVENADGKSLSTKKGTVSMKGTKYRVSFNGQEIYCDGTTVWNYDKLSNEVTVSKLDAASGTITPQKLFTNFYDKDFLYTLNGTKKLGNKTLQEIQMTPTDKGKPFHTVYLLVDKNSKTIYSTKVLEKTGDRYSYTVNSLKSNQPMDDKLFVFDKSKYPGVEVVDLQ